MWHQMRDDDDAFERKLNWFSKHSLLYHKISYAPLQTFSTFIRHGVFSKISTFYGLEKKWDKPNPLIPISRQFNLLTYMRVLQTLFVTWFLDGDTLPA